MTDKQQIVERLVWMVRQVWEQNFVPMTLNVESRDLKDAILTEEYHLVRLQPGAFVWSTPFGPVEVTYRRKSQACQWCGTRQVGRSATCPNCGGPL